MMAGEFESEFVAATVGTLMDTITRNKVRALFGPFSRSHRSACDREAAVYDTRPPLASRTCSLQAC
jgi:hypothetical protein